MTLDCPRTAKEIAMESGIFVVGRSQTLRYNLASRVEIRKKDQKNLRIKPAEYCPKQDDQNPPITNSKTWPLELVQVSICFLRWLTDRKTLNSLEVLACEQALRGVLAAGRKKEEELVTMSLEFEFHLRFPCGSPSTELWDFRQSARMYLTSLLLSSLPISISHQLFRSCKPSFSRRAARAPRRDWSQAVSKFAKPKANVSCQLNFRLFVSCQLKFWPFFSRQVTPTRPSLSSGILSLCILINRIVH